MMPDSTPVLRIRDLFDLPERVVKNDFVIKLHDGIKNEEQTLSTYVVTPKLHDAFRRVFSLLDEAIRSGTSQGAYLHGSFGAGKSHFMAVLDLLLADRPAAWRKPEFHELRAKFTWVGRKKLLILPVHCVGARTLEDRVFEDYVAFVRETRPDAPPPALFRDRELFDMARQALAQQGDEVFFRILNQAATAKTGFAKAVAQKDGAWNRERFESAATASDPVLRKRLFDALTATHYQAFTKGQGHFVDFGPGLAAMSAHAKELGFDAVLLLLDEVILWLATLKGDETRLATEVQKISTLVETSKHARSIPIVSLLARQRGLRELLGETVLGATWAAIDEQLSYWKERFETVELPDSEFPRILRERVLKPKSDDAERAIQKAFEEKRRNLKPAEWDLLRGDYTEEDFQRLYPFSPALVDVLVRLSGALQRERTAMRIVTDLLVNHVGDQPVGSIVPLGDLYDILALEETRDPVLNQRFHSARLAYRGQLLPSIQKKNTTVSAERCQRLRPDHEPTLGCSGCAETACRNDNRIAKTLILAALTHDVPAVSRLDGRRLAGLNHGVITSILPNGAVSRILGMCKDWAAAGVNVSIGTGENPQLALRLDAVDIEPILKQADVVDNYGARQGLLRKLLLASLEIESKESTFSLTIEWRGSKREGQLQFANVRTLTPSAFVVPADCDWHVVIDFPFDERNKLPQDDLQRVEEFMDRDKAWTMVWLPSFFSEELNDVLGRLVRVVHIDEAPDTYLKILSGPDRERAKVQLAEQRRVLTQRVQAALEVAYGVRSSSEAATLLDPAASIEPHTYPLHRDASPASFAKHNMAAAIEEQVDALLSARYPGHPFFKKAFTARTAAKVAELVGRMIDARDRGHQLSVPEKADQAVLKEVAEPLGVVRVREDLATLQVDLLEKIKKAALRAGVEEPNAAQVVEWAQGERPQGLDPVARDLLVDVYARWTGATVFETGRGSDQPIETIPHGKLSTHTAVLRQANLPTPEAWNAATTLGSTLWGTALAGRPCNAKTLSDFGGEIAKKLEAWAGAADLVGKVDKAWESWGRTGRSDGRSQRLETARWGALLVEALTGRNALDAVTWLAAAKPITSARAVERSLAASQELNKALDDGALFAIFEPLRDVSAPWAAEILTEVTEALRSDEHTRPLVATLRGLSERASRALREAVKRTPDPEPEPEPPPPPRRDGDKKAPPVQTSGASTINSKTLSNRVEELRRLWTAAAAQGLTIDVTWETKR